MGHMNGAAAFRLLESDLSWRMVFFRDNGSQFIDFFLHMLNLAHYIKLLNLLWSVHFILFFFLTFMNGSADNVDADEDKFSESGEPISMRDGLEKIRDHRVVKNLLHLE